MVESLSTRILLRLGALATLVFLYAPLVVIGLYAFNAHVTQGWPIQDFSTKWFRVAWEDPGVRSALWLSVQAALGATFVALLLGTLLSLAVSRHRFFGRETVSFLVVLPIALPGIITGLALQTTFQNVGIAFGLLTIVVGHATFCIVVVYNNALARLRRLAPSSARRPSRSRTLLRMDGRRRCRFGRLRRCLGWSGCASASADWPYCPKPQRDLGRRFRLVHNLDGG